jgi:hypothetical protein
MKKKLSFLDRLTSTLWLKGKYYCHQHWADLRERSYLSWHSLSGGNHHPDHFGES